MNDNQSNKIMESERMYSLPTPICMYLLRTLLTSRALEGAIDSTRTTSTNNKPIRWRRLKSMVDDSLSLFQRMLFDYVGNAIDNFEQSVTETNFLDTYPVDPEHIMSISTWLYINHLFPTCHDLLNKLLWNETNNINGNKANPNGVKLLESCYNSYRMLTSLLALEVAVIDQDYRGPSHSVIRMLKCIENQHASDFFDSVKLVQWKIKPKEVSNDETEDDEDEEEKEDVHFPWNGNGPDLAGRGMSLEEDLLLYPSIRKMKDRSDKASSCTYYDELGIATIAYWKLLAETQSKDETSSASLDPLPSPYSGSYRWTLLFPHIITFLSPSHASSTIKRMDELEHLSQFDDYLIGINFTTISLGFDMLHNLINKTPAIRPMNSSTKRSQSPIVQWTHSAQGLESTIAVLFCHVVRLNSMEASIGNKPTDEVHPALKYSPMDVMQMTQILLGFYDPAIQIHVLSSVCQRIKTNQDRVILPKVIDFQRPIIVGMCQNIQHYKDSSVALGDMKVMQTVCDTQDTFLLDLHEAFRDSKSPLPSDDIMDFMSLLEVYSSVFAIVRLQRMWISRCQTELDQVTVRDDDTTICFDEIVNWMDVCLAKLRSFESSLVRLMDFWQKSEADRPDNWHWLFLTNLSLQDALAKPTE